MPDRTIVISDIHLGAAPKRNEQAFLSFLDQAPQWGEKLLINGDLFDFWFEYRQVIPRGHLNTLAKLRRLVDEGMGIQFVGGNHDAWGGSFLEEEVGLEILKSPYIGPLGGRNAYVAHGDGLGGSDWGYRLLKWASQSRPGRTLFQWIHPDIGVPLARHASRTEEWEATELPTEGSRAGHLTTYAQKLLEELPDLDLVVFGHTHNPELREISPGQFYLNSGDWIHHNSFAIVSSTEIRLETFQE